MNAVVCASLVLIVPCANSGSKILTSAFSSGNACTFLASRTLHGLALDGHAPKSFLLLNRFGVPYLAVLASTAWGIVAYLSVNQGSFQVIFCLRPSQNIFVILPFD